MKGSRDWKAIIDQADDIDTRLNDGQKMAALKTVCQTAAILGEDSAAALDVAMMLGIHPSQIDDDTYRDRNIPEVNVVHR
jgi:hypothetical protein